MKISRHTIGFFCAAMMLFSGASRGGGTSPAPDTFFAIHCDPVTGYQGDQARWDKWFDALSDFIALADSWGHRVTIEFTPQWVFGFIHDFEEAADTEKLNALISWRRNGHEIAAHHHPVSHQGSWDGYTNLDPDDPDVVARLEAGESYYGAMDDYGELYEGFQDLLLRRENELYGDSPSSSIRTMATNDPEVDWNTGFSQSTYGVDIEDALSRVELKSYLGSSVYELRHCSLAPAFNSLDDVIAQYESAQADDVVGVNAHCNDFLNMGEGDPRDKIDGWFAFLAGEGNTTRTVSEIIGERTREHNYVRLACSPPEISGADVITLSWSCDFDIFDYRGVPIVVYLAAIRNPVTSDGPASLEDAGRGEAVYLWGRGMADICRYGGRLREPTFSDVVFSSEVNEGVINIAVPAGLDLSGEWCFAAVFLRRDTARFVRPDGLPVANSNITVGQII